MAGTLAGQVLNQRDGQPLAGATMQLAPEGGEQQSGNDGNFSFTGLGAGNNYELVVSKSGFDDGIYGPLVVMDDVPTTIVVALQPSDI